MYVVCGYGLTLEPPAAPPVHISSSQSSDKRFNRSLNMKIIFSAVPNIFIRVSQIIKIMK